MDSELYDEFGNYIGQELESDESDEEEEQEKDDLQVILKNLIAVSDHCTCLSKNGSVFIINNAAS